MKKLPAEVVASLLAMTTVPIAAHASHLPPWAIFISWAATFAMGGPTPENLKKIWPTLPVGSLFAFVIVLCFRQAAEQFSGPALIVAEMVILFTLNATMMSMARVFVTLRFIPFPLPSVDAQPQRDDHRSRTPREQFRDIERLADMIESPFNELRAVGHQPPMFGQQFFGGGAGENGNDHEIAD